MSKHLVIILGLLALALFVNCGSARKNLASTAEEQFKMAKREYDKGKYYNSIDSFQRVVFNFPGATVVDTAQYYLAMSYFGNKEYELAAVEFNRLITNYPQSEFVDDAQYMVGVSYMKNSPHHHSLDQEDLKRAIVSMQDFMIDNPDSPLTPEAKASILEARTVLAEKEYDNGMTYFKMYSYEAARIYFQAVIDDYTDTEYAARALFKLAESFYKEKKYEESKAKFDSFIEIYPDNKLIDKAKKFLSKIADKLNKQNAAG